jgi:hypothetical protein
MMALMQRFMFRTAALALLAGAATLAGSTPLLADAYPVQGHFAYDKGNADEACRTGLAMDFSGDRRFDDGGGVHDYRNVSVHADGASQFAVVDLFFNGQARGKVSYTLRVNDAKHLRMHLNESGKTINLVRCK